MNTLDELFSITRLVEEAISVELADELRRRFEHRGYARYALFDRGSYDEQLAPDVTELVPVLERRVTQAVGRRVTVFEARVLRFGSGDYSLAHHDRVRDGRPIEVVLDLSPAPVPGAEVHYRRRGQVFFRVASTPRALSIVERAPTVTCNHTYVSRLQAAASIVRLVALLH